ncbi:MAG: serine hydrolase family protein [Chloroflexi bacterium]|nr:serine hydrolase family protein [Chloroflexota bacterium]
MTTVLILPGWDNSGPEHWQSLWEAAHPEYRRVQQRDWTTPQRADWVETLGRAVSAHNDDVVLVAHSLGCILTAHWASEHGRPIRGALLVAPGDLDRSGGHDAPGWSASWRPVPLARFPFPSIVVGSMNDPYCTAERSAFFAASWGSRLVNIGAHGHINVAAGFGLWPQGESLLQELIR